MCAPGRWCGSCASEKLGDAPKVTQLVGVRHPRLPVTNIPSCLPALPLEMNSRSQGLPSRQTRAGPWGQVRQDGRDWGAVSEHPHAASCPQPVGFGTRVCASRWPRSPPGEPFCSCPCARHERLLLMSPPGASTSNFLMKRPACFFFVPSTV